MTTFYFHNFKHDQGLFKNHKQTNFEVHLIRISNKLRDAVPGVGLSLTGRGTFLFNVEPDVRLEILP